MSAVQGSVEWLKERAGHATASKFKCVLAKIKTGEASTRRDYRWQLVTERLTGQAAENFVTADMLWGTQQEPLARLAYEVLTGEPVAEVGFLLHPRLDWCGGSPDGLVDRRGMVEFKCPKSGTHLEWLDAGVCPSEHIPQVQGGMWIAERDWCDFVSYDPRFPKHLQTFAVRVKRDEAYIAALEKEVVKFLAEVDELHDRLLNGRALAVAA